jgi:hypothetical protein
MNHPQQKQLDLILINCSQKEAILNIDNLLLTAVGKDGIYTDTNASYRSISYGKIKSEKFAMIRLERKLAGEPKFFLKLRIPYVNYAEQSGLTDKSGWMYFETKDWQDITRIFYYKSTGKKGNPHIVVRRESFERLFLAEEREKHKLQNKTKLEIVTDKALKLAGYPGFIGSPE